MIEQDELEELRSLIDARRPQLIGIDGMNGVGKSRRVAAKLGLQKLSIDEYLTGNGKFLEGIDYERICHSAQLHDGPLIVEGCCLLAVVERAGLMLDLHVYVRRLSRAGRWEDEEVGEGNSLEYVLKTNRAIARALHQKPDSLAADLARYHAAYRPMQRADLVLNLIERPAD